VNRDSWLDKARATGRHARVYPQLSDVLHGNGFTFCADGYRAHLWHCEDKANGESAKAAEYIALILKDRPVTSFEITALALMAACKMALALRQSSKDDNHLYISPNGSLKFHSENPEVGEVSGEFVDGDKWGKWGHRKGYLEDRSIPLAYRHEGEDTTFAVNPKYIRDALSIFDEQDTIAVSLRGQAVVIEPARERCGFEEWPQAVVMTIKIR